ncbi:MAG TPA: ATP-binding protein, partial [Gemmatimonadaceae bacterium]|nr:ATP-binding protein [Gemmatimonadaceae bacterium]
MLAILHDPAFLLPAVVVLGVIVAVVLAHATRRTARSLAEAQTLARQLEAQAVELRRRVEELDELKDDLEAVNLELLEANAEARSARIRAEAAVHRKEEVLAILDTVLDSSPVAFALYDRHVRFIRINRAFAELTGQAPLDHIGAEIEEVAPSLAPALRLPVERVLADGKPYRDVEITATEGRETRHWLASFYPVRTPRGDVLGVGGLMLEVSERKSLEEQFRQAQKMEAVGRLAGGIAHDFNNLLTVMTSCSEMLLNDLAAEDTRRGDVEEIRGAAQRAASLTRQLLAFSRKQILQPTLLDLNEVAKDMERMVSRVVGENVKVETRIDPDLGFVRADLGQIEQVVMNLVVNARDAMPDGGRIVIATRNVPADGDDRGAVALEVHDQGTGIPTDALPHIFEPFFTTKERGKGTGLGLSTVYGIVKQSGGDVEVESMPGHGSIFRVVLPRYREDSQPRAGDVVYRVASRRDVTVLLIEDEESVRMLATRILEREGYRVLAA